MKNYLKGNKFKFKQSIKNINLKRKLMTKSYNKFRLFYIKERKVKNQKNKWKNYA